MQHNLEDGNCDIVGVAKDRRERVVAWFFLILAIILEVSAVTMLSFIPTWLEPFSNEGTFLLFGFVVSTSLIAKANLLVMIAISYYCMSLALRKIALGVAYSFWEILGMIGILLVSLLFLPTAMSTQQYIGVAVGFIGIICVILGEDH